MAEVAQFLSCSFIVNTPGYPDNIESVFQLFAEGSFVQIKKKLWKFYIWCSVLVFFISYDNVMVVIGREKIHEPKLNLEEKCLVISVINL